MNWDHDRSYFRFRAIEERRRAAQCADHAIARVHLDFASAYERRVLCVLPLDGSRDRRGDD